MITKGSAIAMRRAGAGDLLAVLGVHALRNSDGDPPSTASELEERTWADMLAVPGQHVYLAELGDVAVGTASAMVFPNLTYQCKPTAIIEAVVVAHSYRRRGIATLLLERIIEEMDELGCNKIQLLSHKRHASDGAHQLYSALGFEPEAEGFRLYLGKVPEAVLKAREIYRP